MGDFLADWYLVTKSLHVISVTAWMAGMFYLPRLFVYHAEQVEPGSKTDAMFQTMERRLLRGIINPAMLGWFRSCFAFGMSSPVPSRKSQTICSGYAARESGIFPARTRPRAHGKARRDAYIIIFFGWERR